MRPRVLFPLVLLTLACWAGVASAQTTVTPFEAVRLTGGPCQLTAGAAAPSGGNNCDWYLKSDGTVYIKTGGAWVALLRVGDISGTTPAALTRVDDTNVTVTLGGTPATALLQAVSLTMGWSGQLGVARGGTNLASYAVGDLLYASDTTTLAKLADVAAGSYLRSGGVTTAPVWSTLVLPNAITDHQVVWANGTNTYGSSANLTFDDATLAVTGIATVSGAVKHPSYASHTTAWGIDATGGADFRYVFVDELHAKAFIADVEQALAGGQIIAKSVAKVAASFDTASATQLIVESFAGYDTVAVFAADDVVALRSFARTDGALTIGNAYGTVALDTTYGTKGYDAATHTQAWTWTKIGTPTLVAGAGSLALDFGSVAAPYGYYEVSAIDGAWGVNSPYAQVVTWATTPASKTVRARFGNLTGLTSTTEYGLLAGTYAATNGQYFRASDQAFELHGVDLKLWDSTTNVFAVMRNSGSPYLSLGNGAPSACCTTAGIFLGWDHAATKAKASFYGDANNYLTWDGTNLSWKGANTSLSTAGVLTATGGVFQTATGTGARIVIDSGTGSSTGIQGYNASNVKQFALLTDGSGSLGVNGITWTNAGVVTAAGWTFSAGKLTNVTGGNTVTLEPAGTYAFLAGPTGASTFTVTPAGALTATSGVVGGFTLANNSLTSGTGLWAVGMSSQSNATYSTSVLADNPVAYWRLNDGTGASANDSTANNYDMTAVGTPATATGARSPGDTSAAQALLAETNYQYRTAALLSMASDWTIELWANTAAGDQGELFSQSNSGTAIGTNRIHLYIWDGDYTCLAVNDAGAYIGVTAVGTYTDAWHHVACTWQASTTNLLVLYVDGIERARHYAGFPGAATYTTMALATRVSSGGWAGGSTSSMQDVALYDSALSADTISNHFSGGAFWAGSTSFSTAAFSVNAAGRARMTHGNIGGFRVGATTIETNYGDDTVGLGTGVGGVAFWAGSETPTLANFRVKSDGETIIGKVTFSIGDPASVDVSATGGASNVISGTDSGEKVGLWWNHDSALGGLTIGSAALRFKNGIRLGTPTSDVDYTNAINAAGGFYDNGTKLVNFAGGSLSGGSCSGGEFVNAWSVDGNGLVTALTCGAPSPLVELAMLRAMVADLQARLAALEGARR